MLKVRVVGAGSAFGKKYYNTSLMVDFENGYRLLIDCGHNVPKALHEQGISIDTIDGLLVTHIHADHVGGIEELAFMNRYVFGGRKMDLFAHPIILSTLWRRSLKGGLAHTEEGVCNLDDYFIVRTLNVSSVNELGIRVYPTDHVKNKDSFAVGIGDQFFFSGDTKFDPELIEGAADCYRTIFHDCQLPLPDGTVIQGGVHAHLHELLTLPENVQKKMFLTHYGDNVEDYVGKTGRMRFASEGTEYLV